MLIWIYKMVKKLPILSQVYIVAIVFIHSAKREAFSVLPCHQEQTERLLL